MFGLAVHLPSFAVHLPCPAIYFHKIVFGIRYFIQVIKNYGSTKITTFLHVLLSSSSLHSLIWIVAENWL